MFSSAVCLLDVRMCGCECFCVRRSEGSVKKTPVLELRRGGHSLGLAMTEFFFSLVFCSNQLQVSKLAGQSQD